jgi:signal peptide peptidase SppA
LEGLGNQQRKILREALLKESAAGNRRLASFGRRFMLGAMNLGAMNLDFILDRLPLGRWRKTGPLVPVIRLAGVIGAASRFQEGMTDAALAPIVERAFSMRGVAAVALAINSPGGAATQSALIAGRIRALADEKKVPLIAFVEDVAASGGYWLATAADEIYAAETSVVGSIGVIAAGFGFEDAIARLGIRRRLYTAGARKSLLDPFLAEKPEDVERLKSLQREIHEAFKTHVRTRRAGKLKMAEDELFTGEFWTGARGLELGLIDGIGDLRSVLRRRFGEKVRIRPVGGGKSWLRRRFGLGAGGAAGDLAGTLDAGLADWAPRLIAALEARALWSRYGI